MQPQSWLSIVNHYLGAPMVIDNHGPPLHTHDLTLDHTFLWTTLDHNRFISGPMLNNSGMFNLQVKSSIFQGLKFHSSPEWKPRFRSAKGSLNVGKQWPIECPICVQNMEEKGREIGSQDPLLGPIWPWTLRVPCLISTAVLAVSGCSWLIHGSFSPLLKPSLHQIGGLISYHYSSKLA